MYSVRSPLTDFLRLGADLVTGRGTTLFGCLVLGSQLRVHDARNHDEVESDHADRHKTRVFATISAPPSQTELFLSGYFAACVSSRVMICSSCNQFMDLCVP